MLGVARKQAILDRYNELAMNYSEETADEMTDLQDEIEAQGLWDLDGQVDQAMDALGCPAEDAEIESLSGGERRRVALCRLLLEKPEMLLLDEPTNHLDAETVSWLEGHLRSYPGAILIVTHDRYFLDNVTGWILELDRGRGIPYEGNYSTWLKQKHKRLLQEGREDEARMRALEAESEWISSSPKARQSKSKARIQRYEDLLAKSEERVPSITQIVIPVAERLGQNVIEFDALKKGFNDRLLIDDLSFKLPPGGIVGVIGPNGAGKTTLFRMITGQETPDAGSMKVGDSVELGYVDQSRDTLDGKKKRLGGNLGRARDHLSRQEGDQLPRLLLGVQLQGFGSAKEGRHAVGRRAQPRAPGQDVEEGRERPPARRAYQRPRRRHATGSGRSTPGFCGLRRHHQPRSLLPRPDRDPHVGLRGREPCRMVRGQLRRLRGGQEAPPRHRQRHPPSAEIQEIRALSVFFPRAAKEDRLAGFFSSTGLVAGFEDLGGFNGVGLEGGVA